MLTSLEDSNGRLDVVIMAFAKLVDIHKPHLIALGHMLVPPLSDGKAGFFQNILSPLAALASELL